MIPSGIDPARDADTRRRFTAPQVRLTFDEPVGLIAADEQVISATGVRADTGRVRLAEGGTTIVLPLRPNLPRGTYSATWRVVSADTHMVSGSITFGLGVQPGGRSGRHARPHRAA
ncbi:MAG: copper resistance CopC family protein [Streptosporangiaceae bacterium]